MNFVGEMPEGKVAIRCGDVRKMNNYENLKTLAVSPKQSEHEPVDRGQRTETQDIMAFQEWAGPGFPRLRESKHDSETRVSVIRCYPIYPTPPLGQDMTQGQFLSGV